MQDAVILDRTAIWVTWTSPPVGALQNAQLGASTVDRAAISGYLDLPIRRGFAERVSPCVVLDTFLRIPPTAKI